jgi:erythrocyte band 7 integral membrane protein
VQSVVTEREAIAFEIAEIVGDVADKWGVSIEGILIKVRRPPPRTPAPR